MKQVAKLMKQAGLEPYYDAQQAAIEKFAELLIQRACYIVNVWSDEEAENEDDDIMPVAKLKEHFGLND